MNVRSIYLSLLMFTGLNLMLWGAAKSTTSDMDFDVNFDGTREMRLNSTGLAVGTSLSPAANLHIAGNAIFSSALFVGTTSGSSNLNIGGSLGFSTNSISGNANLGSHSYVLVDTSSANAYLTLPYAGNCSGQMLTIKKTSSLNKAFVSGGANKIESWGIAEMSTSTSGTPAMSVVSNGQQWYITSLSGNSWAPTASENLIGWWSFDEPSGATVYGQHSSGNNGTMGSPGVVSRVTGPRGGALEFDGSSNVSLGNNFKLQPPFTICNWLYWSNPGTTDAQTFFSKTNAGFSYALRYIVSQSKIKFQLYTDVTNNGLFYTTSTVSANTWAHVACSYDGVNSKIFLNGNLENTYAISGNLIHSNINAYFGYGGFCGRLDDFRIYNKALSASEIQEIMR